MAKCGNSIVIIKYAPSFGSFQVSCGSSTVFLSTCGCYVDVTRMGSTVSNHACSFTQFWKPILFDHGGVEDRILRFTHANFIMIFLMLLFQQACFNLDDQHHGQQLRVQLWVLPVCRRSLMICSSPPKCHLQL